MGITNQMFDLDFLESNLEQVVIIFNYYHNEKNQNFGVVILINLVILFLTKFGVVMIILVIFVKWTIIRIK